MAVSPELKQAQDQISEMMREQDPQFNELRGVGIGLNETIMVLLKDAETTTLTIPDIWNGYRINRVSVGDPRAL